MTNLRPIWPISEAHEHKIWIQHLFLSSLTPIPYPQLSRDTKCHTLVKDKDQNSFCKIRKASCSRSSWNPSPHWLSPLLVQPHIKTKQWWRHKKCLTKVCFTPAFIYYWPASYWLLADQWIVHHLDENGQDAPAQHATTNAYPRSLAPSWIHV